MQCPFFRKMNVKYCDLCRSAMIPLRSSNQAMEQCSGPGFVNCSLLDGKDLALPHQDRCPHLCVGDVHFCSLDPAQKLIPCNQATVSKCMDDGHRYCQLFLAMTGNETEAGSSSAGSSETPLSLRETAGIPMVETLAFASNHMWYDHGNGGTCHVGVDAFFTRAIGRIDEVIYPYHENNRRPTVRFKVEGVNFDLVFPKVLQGTEFNSHVVAEPEEVLRDPYGRGWLFEGITLPASSPRSNAPEDGLLVGSAAQRWMRSECDRLAEFVHDHLPQRQGLGQPDTILIQDGGTPCGPLTENLDRGSLVRLHSDFFTINSGRVKT